MYDAIPAIACVIALATSSNFLNRPEPNPNARPGIANINAIRTVIPFINGAAEFSREPFSSARIPVAHKITNTIR